MSNGANNFLNGIGKAVETIPSLYDDAIKPSAKESGKTAALLVRAINAALSPLEIWVMNKEYNVAETKKLLEQKLENVAPEKIVSPEPFVAVPTIQAISYSMNSNELRNLYANLLAKSMNVDTKNFVHPAYIETIKQLSPDDATYFKHLCSLSVRPMLDVNILLPNALSITITSQVNNFSKGYTQNQALSINNLSRLGLINIPYGVWYGDDSIYEELLSSAKTTFSFEKYKTLYPDATGIDYSKSRIDITSYGTSFFKTCVQ